MFWGGGRCAFKTGACCACDVTRPGAAIGCRRVAAGSGALGAAMATAAVESALREALAGPAPGAAALGALRDALAAAGGGEAALGPRERERLGAVLRCLAASALTGPEEPAGPWRGCFGEAPPGLALSALLAALSEPRGAAPRSVRLWGWGGGAPCGAVPLPSPLSPLRAGAGLRALLEELERLVRGRLPAVLGELCRQRGAAEPGAGLLGAVVALPERLSNALQGGHHPSVFLPQNYFPLLAAAIVEALHEVAAALRGGGGWGRASPGGFHTQTPVLAF